MCRLEHRSILCSSLARIAPHTPAFDKIAEDWGAELVKVEGAGHNDILLRMSEYSGN